MLIDMDPFFLYKSKTEIILINLNCDLFQELL